MNLKTIIIFLMCCCFSLPGFAIDSDFYARPFTPENIHELTSEKGVSEVYEYINNSEILQARLQKNITSGDKEWLAVFLLLRQHPESEWGGQLDLFLAYAITSNTEPGLQVVEQYQNKYQEYFTENMLPSYATLICGYVYEDWILGTGAKTDWNLAESAHDALCERKQSLDKVTKSSLLATRDACRESVIKKRNFWSKYCNKK